MDAHSAVGEDIVRASGDDGPQVAVFRRVRLLYVARLTVPAQPAGCPDIGDEVLVSTG
jgi:hypothetical protein